MIKKIFKIAIPNRGEIAVRIIRATQELGIKNLLLYSEADRDSLAYRICDEAICIGPSESKMSYLNLEAVIGGALSGKADALHPGFGFLSEKPSLSQACEERGIVFIGPSSKSLQFFSNKMFVCDVAKKIGIPTLPSFSVPLLKGEVTKSVKKKSKNAKKKAQQESLQEALDKALQIGYPLMVKVTEGGGGRGLRRVDRAEDLERALESSRREGESAFQSQDVFFEKYIEGAKHIEVQIFGSADGEIFHLGERDCSLQRKHQKVIEEAPAFDLSHKMRSQLVEAALQLIRYAKNYKSAGTVEFLVRGDEYYFLEVNPRLQVEHPVTEMVMGVDLVKAQILTAQNKPLLWDSVAEPLKAKGHAIECRILAEDSYKFREEGGVAWPSLGTLGGCIWPHGPGRRFEIGFEEGDDMTPYYDSLLAKVIVWDESRLRAIQKMKKTLSEIVLFGLKTNIPYLISILDHTDFISGDVHTDFIASTVASFSSVEMPHETSHLEKSSFKRIPSVSNKGGLYFLTHEELQQEEKELAEEVLKKFSSDLEGKHASSKKKKIIEKKSSSECSFQDPWFYAW